jgi:hypothetical protein
MPGKNVLIIICAIALIGNIACRRDGTGTTAEDSPAGLKQTMETIYKAATDGDGAALESLCGVLVLPDADAWFLRVFGPEKGATLATDYRERSLALVPEAGKLFSSVAAKRQSQIHVDRFTDPNDERATGLQKDALAAMREPTALYSVRFVKPGETHGMHLWSFVHTDGAFRLVGKMRPAQD